MSVHVKEKQPTGKVYTCSSRVSGNVRVWEVGELLMLSAFGKNLFVFVLGQVDSSDQREQRLVTRLVWRLDVLVWREHSAGTGNHR